MGPILNTRAVFVHFYVERTESLGMYALVLLKFLSFYHYTENWT
jgi:hypothetical protein